MYDASDPIRPAASKAGGAYHDPAVHARLQEVATRAIGSFRGVVDAFLVGYAEGKNEEIRRALEEEIERQSALHLAVYRADTLAVKFAGQSVRSAVPQPAGETVAIVAKIVAGRTQPDQVFACVLPASGLGDREPLEWSVATDCIDSGHIFDQVSVEIVSQGEVLLGDIAIGTTWSSIAANADAAP